MEPIAIKVEAPQLVNESLSPLAKGIGNTLQSIWDICFGWIDNTDEKIKYKRLIALNKFKEYIESGISEVPTEDLCNPKISVVGPTLEASKYYFEEEDIRNLFAKLIINSTNRKICDLIHPSFLEIVKQLSPVDANLFHALYCNSPIPVCKVFRVDDPAFFSMTESFKWLGISEDEDDSYLEFPNVNGTDLSRHHIHLDGINFSHLTTERSFDNLSRLGLVCIDYSNTIPNFPKESFLRNPEIQDALRKSTPEIPINLIPGVCSLTKFGETFAKVCL